MPDDNPLRVRCPWCHATVGDPCFIPGTQIVLRRSRAHPSRIEAINNEMESEVPF